MHVIYLLNYVVYRYPQSAIIGRFDSDRRSDECFQECYVDGHNQVDAFSDEEVMRTIV